MKSVVDQKFVIDFVARVETKKKFKRDFNYIFRHIVSEVGELDEAIYNLEKYKKLRKKTQLNYFKKRIAYELLDIFFLTCYMADVFDLELNDHIKDRMRIIAIQSGISRNGPCR